MKTNIDLPILFHYCPKSVEQVDDINRTTTYYVDVHVNLPVVLHVSGTVNHDPSKHSKCNPHNPSMNQHVPSIPLNYSWSAAIFYKQKSLVIAAVHVLLMTSIVLYYLF